MEREVQFLLYNMPEDSGKVQVIIKDETIWCTQKAMAQLFGVGVPAVSKHLKNIFDEGELAADSVISKMETTAADNKIYETSFYSLDAIIAKNYLQEKEIRQLERTVAGYFDYIEDLIERENTFNMEQFAASVNEFLTFRRYQILPDKGKISAAQAKKKAEAEYALFDPTQQIDSDFDKEVRRLLDKE